MQIVSSYGVEVKKQNIPIRHTLDIFPEGSFLPDWGVCRELGRTFKIGNTQKRFNEAEHLVHETKKNRARFAFDRHFPQNAVLFEKSGHSARAWKCILLSDTAEFVGKGRLERKTEADLRESCDA
ncbi:MAG: hypothetical protein ACLSE4_02305 [Clostridium sp.]